MSNDMTALYLSALAAFAVISLVGFVILEGVKRAPTVTRRG
jgi:hypothetical protein